MTSRREFLIATFVAGSSLVLPLGQLARAENESHIKAVTAITKVFGEGQKLTAVAVEYDTAIDAAKVDAKAFAVEGRSIIKAYANAAAATAATGVDGAFVILELSPDDANAPLYIMGKGPGSAPTHKPATASLKQTAALSAKDGTTLGLATASTNKAINLVVDEFKQLEFKDAKTGGTLKYNLFVPKNYDKSKSYPLVLFMHDAGVTSADPMMTLVQGLGPTAFANDEDQAKHEAFVLAPQFSRQTVNDKSEASSDLDTTINLVKALTKQYSIDQNRLYTTGQSGGGMMSIAMMIKYPDVFAAAFLVACQWDEKLVAPLSKNRMWIVVSEGDLKAFPGQNAMTAIYAQNSGKVAHEQWEGTWDASQFSDAVAKLKAEDVNVRYVTLKKGTVVPPGQQDDGGSNHVNTWRIAYAIAGIRDWLFEQHK